MITILDKSIPFGGGISLPANKSISLQQALKKATLPSIVRLPIRQHIGLPAKPIVTVGESVLKGQTIAKAQGSISAPTHASTSGVIQAIAKYVLPNPSGAQETCIVIKPDGKDAWIKEPVIVADYQRLEPVAIQRKVLEAGIVGLGGAGFPTAMKLIPGLSLDIELLILNAAECEPYISCDESLLQNYINDVIMGVEILAYALQVDECVIAIEDNKTETIAILKAALKNHTTINLMQVESLYPAGGEKQLIKAVTGVEVPAGGLPVDIGVVCYNVGTAFAVKKAVLDDEPLISRVVTVTGAGINQPGNLEVLIGTPINEIIDQCGGYNEQFEYLIMGGPMMGYRLHSDLAPLIKTSNCLLAVGKEMAITKKAVESPCIRCDECASVCPAGLQAQQLYWHSQEFNSKRLEDYRLFDCIECGCCAYVCPSHISLVDHYRQSKWAIWNNRYKQLEAKKNKQRYVDKQFRVQQQDEKRLRQRQTANAQKGTDLSLQQKQSEIAAAVRRVKDKRRVENTTD